jgi:hypothetical protein
LAEAQLYGLLFGHTPTSILLAVLKNLTNVLGFSERLNFFEPQFSHMGQLLAFTLII